MCVLTHTERKDGDMYKEKIKAFKPQQISVIFYNTISKLLSTLQFFILFILFHNSTSHGDKSYFLNIGTLQVVLRSSKF
jgi:hypothetical protein